MQPLPLDQTLEAIAAGQRNVLAGYDSKLEEIDNLMCLIAEALDGKVSLVVHQDDEEYPLGTKDLGMIFDGLDETKCYWESHRHSHLISILGYFHHIGIPLTIEEGEVWKLALMHDPDLEHECVEDVPPPDFVIERYEVDHE